MDIQPVSGLTTPNVAAGGAPTTGPSITELAQQHGVSRQSLVELVQTKIQQTRQASGQPPLDQGTLDQLVDHALERDREQGASPDEPSSDAAAPGGYTASAQPIADRATGPGSISIFA